MVVLLVLCGALTPIHPARAGFVGLDVTPGAHSHPGLIRDPYVFVPGESLTFTLRGDTVGEVFDAAIPIISTGQLLAIYDDLSMPIGLSLTLTYFVPLALPDGDNYRVEVGDSNWIESSRTSTLLASQRFAVQAYELGVEVDRLAYLGGDDVIVTWSAKDLKDGTFAADGFGQLWVYDALGASLITPGVHTYAAASGSFGFRLPDLANPMWDGIVQSWFNDTASNPTRFQQAFAFFAIDSLGVIADVPAQQYAPGTVTATVHAFATTNPSSPSPSDPPEPYILIDISVWELNATGPILHPEYGGSGLVTDTAGEATHSFTLNWTVADGTVFEVRANASHQNGIWRWTAADQFLVTAAQYVLSVTFDKPLYAPARPVGVHYRITPASPGPTPPSTFEFEFGLDGGPRVQRTLMTVEGNLQYSLPPGTPDGAALFTIEEWVTGLTVSETIEIDAIPPDAARPSATVAQVGIAIVVDAVVSDERGVTSVFLHWAFSDGTNGTIAMSPVGGNIFSGAIPPRASSGTLEMYVVATDFVGNVGTSEIATLNVTAALKRPPASPFPWVLVAGATLVLGTAAAAIVLRWRSSRRGPGERRPNS